MDIKLKNITKKYKDRTIFENFSFSFQSNGLYLIKGSSGSGKTSLLNILSLISMPDSGELFYNNILINKKNIDLYRRKNGIILQNSYLINELTLRENLLFFNTMDKEFYNISESLGLLKVMDTKAKHLSVGERQRANLLRVIMKEPDVIFADEPFASVDRHNIDIIKKYLIEYSQKDNKLVFIVTHREDIIINAKKTIFLREDIKAL